MTNVLQFPNRSHLPLTTEDSLERIKRVREMYSSEAAIDSFQAVINICQEYGFFTVSEKINVKDMAAIREIINSAMLRYSGVYHPLQEAVDEIIDLDEQDTNESE